MSTPMIVKSHGYACGMCVGNPELLFTKAFYFPGLLETQMAWPGHGDAQGIWGNSTTEYVGMFRTCSPQIHISFRGQVQSILRPLRDGEVLSWYVLSAVGPSR